MLAINLLQSKFNTLEIELAAKDIYIKEFYFGPKIEENKVSAIFASIETMLTICKFLSNYFDVPKEEDCLKFNKRKKEIDEKYKNLELNK